MKNHAVAGWKKVPASVRKPIVFVVGLLFIIAAGLTGWLPGPGGIPLFLLGIAVLATEFHWAQTIRDAVLDWLKRFSAWFRRHPFPASLACAAVIFILIGLAVLVNKLLVPILF